MTTRSATLLFDFAEIRAFISSRLLRVIEGNRVQPGSFRFASGEDVVRHANDRRGIQPPAQFSENRRVRTQPAADCLVENVTEVLFVFLVSLVSDSLLRLKSPITVHRLFSILHAHKFPRRTPPNFPTS